jgi:hypothetical protein
MTANSLQVVSVNMNFAGSVWHLGNTCSGRAITATKQRAYTIMSFLKMAVLEMRPSNLGVPKDRLPKRSVPETTYYLERFRTVAPYLHKG